MYFKYQFFSRCLLVVRPKPHSRFFPFSLISCSVGAENGCVPRPCLRPVFRCLMVTSSPSGLPGIVMVCLSPPLGAPTLKNMARSDFLCRSTIGPPLEPRNSGLLYPRIFADGGARGFSVPCPFQSLLLNQLLGHANYGLVTKSTSRASSVFPAPRGVPDNNYTPNVSCSFHFSPRVFPEPCGRDVLICPPLFSGFWCIPAIEQTGSLWTT